MGIWYDKSKLLSYNSILNFLIGQRGGGKTYGFKTWAVEDFLKTGRQFFWLRRFKTELLGTSRELGVVNTWFNDIAHLYPNHELKIEGNIAYIDGKIAGYFGALSISEHWKSVPFVNVNKVIMDEFLIRTGVGKQYIKNEVVVFLELMETVGRMRDDIRFFLIGNALSFSNPYFHYFGIKPFREGIYHDSKRGITVQLYNNEKFKEVKEQTKLGRLIKDTEYGDYAIQNVFLLDNDKFIEKRTPGSHLLYNIVWDKHTFGLWVDPHIGRMFVSRKHNPSETTYTVKAEDHDINMYLLGLNHPNLKRIKNAFEHGYLFFEDQIIKDVMLNVIGVI